MERLKNKKLFYRILHPRLVLILITKYGNRVNLIPITWHTPISEKSLLFGIVIDKDSYTYELLEKSKKFTLNLLPKKYLDDIWKIGTKSGKEIDKTKIVSFELENSYNDFNIPHIKQAIAFIEGFVEEKIEFEEEVFYICRLYDAYVNSNYFKDLVSSRANVLFHVGKNFFTTNTKYFTPKI